MPLNAWWLERHYHCHLYCSLMMIILTSLALRRCPAKRLRVFDHAFDDDDNDDDDNINININVNNNNNNNKIKINNNKTNKLVRECSPQHGFLSGVIYHFSSCQTKKQQQLRKTIVTPGPVPQGSTAVLPQKLRQQFSGVQLIKSFLQK